MSKLFGFETSGRSHPLSKPFGISALGRGKPSSDAAAKKMSLSEIKLQMALCLQDMQGSEIDRLRYKIRSVRDVRELWLLRSNIHQAICQQQSQQIAEQVINKLLPCFAGWIPADQLTKI